MSEKEKTTDYVVRVNLATETKVLRARSGMNLREVLRDNNISFYGKISRWVNCRGRGICATCGVWVNKGPDPVHWHDSIARQWGYPRLSCQIKIHQDLEITILPDKIMWGKVIPTLPTMKRKYLSDKQK